MAVLSMYKLFIFGLNRDRKQVLEEIQKSELIEISDLDTSNEYLTRKETTQTISQINHHMNTAQQALAILDEYVPEKTGFLSSRRTLSISKYHMKQASSDAALQSALRIIEFADKIHQCKEDLRRIDAKQIALTPYLALDVPMQITHTKNTQIRSGLSAGLITDEMVREALRNNKVEGAYYEIISAQKEHSALWFVYLNEHSDKMHSVFQELSVQEPSFSLSHHTPKKKVEVLEQAKGELEDEIAQYIKKIEEQQKNKREVELLYDHLGMRKQKYQEIAKMGLTNHTFMMEGYIPQKYADKLKNKLEKDFAVYMELTVPKPDEAPVMFANNGFVAPVEGITSTYSMPSSVDIDPNPIMSFFYYLFFGMMFSDAGYGIMLSVACAILGYSNILEPSKRHMFRMFFFCGLSTTFWGFMYGGFFGDATKTISSAFFGTETILKPIWMDPTQEPLRLLIFSVILGIIQLIIGMGIKFFMLCRQKKVWDAVFDVGFWILIMVCIGVFATGMYLNTSGVVLDEATVSGMNNFALYGLIAGAAGLVLTQGRSKKNIFAKIFGGILSLYDVTGYIGDMLSYSRLLALGLATGVIASVINLLAALFVNLGPGGVVFFVIIFVLGHLVNFAINMLGAYVHTMRLQYVEFFSKFYEGGGKPFIPFNMGTKFYRFSKEK